MQKYFNGTKFNSFRRQLQIYGFRFIKDKSSPDHGSYVHPFFLKGKTELCSKMVRQKIKGNKKLRRMTHNEKVKVEIASNDITKKENFKTSKSSIFFPTQIKIILLSKVADA